MSTFELHWENLEVIARFSDFGAILPGQMQAAMSDLTQLMQADAQAYMWDTFKNPQGPLEDAVTPVVSSPFEGRIEDAMPQAWRRERGFSGQSDSLGRYYPDDPGIGYFAHTLEADRDAIENRFAQAMAMSFLELGVG